MAAQAKPGQNISLQDLMVRFGEQIAIENVSLDLTPGSFTSIVGPSGCGKSTLLRCIAALIAPTRGSIISPGPYNAAFVFQSPNLLRWRNVVQNVGLPLEIQRTSQDVRQRRIESSLKLVGLGRDHHSKLPSMLSGGMQMRVSLARALVTDPRLLLLDEPFAALDDMLRQRLNEDLTRIWQEKRWTALFVTHNVSEAVFLSERVVVMTNQPGQIAAIVDIPFEYPRDRDLKASSTFATLVGNVARQLERVAL